MGKNGNSRTEVFWKILSGLKLFPPDLHQCSVKSLHDLPASSCSDVNLTRVLKNYDAKNKTLLVEDIERGGTF